MVKGNEYDPTDNILLNIVIANMLKYDNKIKVQAVRNIIYNECLNELVFHLYDNRDIAYFDYHMKVDKFGDMIEIFPHNILTGLWFLNIFPQNSNQVIKNNEYTYNGMLYKFNADNNKITKKQL